MADEIEEGLEHLAHKRSLHYEAKKESLRREIEQLRDFFSSMEKERELLECQLKATQVLCRKKLVKAEKELQQAQGRLRETRNEAALLLEGKHQEMERLQKERDDCEARAGHLAGEFDFFKGYTRYLEQKICVLVAKLHEYHHDLHKKAEEIVETRSRAVSELEWVKQSMMNFEKNLLEFHNTNSQLSSEKEFLMKELQGMKQLEAPSVTEMINLRNKETPSSTPESNHADKQQHPHAYIQQYPRENLDDISETSQLVQELLGEDFKYTPSGTGDWTSDEDGNTQHQHKGCNRIEVPKLF